MGSDIRHLHLIDLVVSMNHVVEPMLPMHGYKGQVILVKEEEPGLAVHHLLDLRLGSVVDDCLEHLRHIVRDGKFPCSGMRLGGSD